MDEAADPIPEGAAPQEPAEPERVLLHMPVDVRSASLVVLAVLASLFVLHWAKAVFIPLLLGIMLSYALSPVVDRLERWRAPRALASGVLMLAFVAGLAWAGYILTDDATRLVESLPDAAQKIAERLRSSESRPAKTIENVQKAAAELERAAAGAASAPASAPGQEDGARGGTTTPPRAAPRKAAAAASQPAPAQPQVTRVQIEKPHFNVRDYLWPGTLGVVEAVGQAAAVLFIAYFLLASGNTFRRKMVRIAGPTFSEKRLTVQALDEISEQIERYLLVQIATSALLGVVTGLAFWVLGLQNAALWGLLAGITNLVPYVGAILVVGGSALVAFLQFGEIDNALAIGGSAFVIHTFIGYWLTPWLTSRAGRMNPVAVFAGVLAWGWLWGVWGLLLGAPILMVVKSVCDRVDDLKPIGELLGE